MPKLKSLSGDDILKIFLSLGFALVSQKGSHVKLQRFINNSKQTLIIPVHKELDRGTIQGIYKQSLRYITEESLKSHFYSD